MSSKHLAAVPEATDQSTVHESLEAYRKRTINDIPQLPPRQDPLESQLADLQMVANRLGMGDAAALVKCLIQG